ncbi:uncharacterized protein VICG_01832 [Vittaforma corneae ATCC 50505]|uniref:SPX domain-containing protein n=1 Tax=Vittaforma corneae (strain ATCC 50505) TaxID=993615 RepID=L2GJT8_VITCO|nr:uncharacterized protein VICG_01832 [Vittaforma corneae ATCC 50505]ELA41133.1 hypothetical protein VICG_01832 [Vittaforma corneae ATCC 50505]
MYSTHLLNYDRLKKLIKPNFTDQQEEVFRNSLDSDILKVFAFINDTHIAILSSIEEHDSTEARTDHHKDTIYSFIDFIRTNIKYLKKILQRHDKYTGYSIMDEYKGKIKEKKLEIRNLTKLLTTLNSAETQMPSHYLVPSECLVSFKMNLLKHLKLTNESLEDSCVNTVYLDNEDFDLYLSTLDNKPDAFQVRLRWYGLNSSEIFCEMGDRTVKIPERLILDFLNGKDIWNDLNKIDTKGSNLLNATGNTHISSGNAVNSEADYREIRDKIKGYRLKPVLRTFFRRCTFEDLESNANKGVRIVMDSNVVMIKETGGEYPLRFWRRDGSWPFRNLAQSEVTRFPHTVVEVKVPRERLETGQLAWLEHFLAESRIERVDSFNKFVHGCAILYPTVTNVLPHWLPQISTPNGGNPDVVKRSADADVLIYDSDISYDTSPVSDGRSRIAIPVRVEPKAFFANERTFLSWVQFAIFLGGIGTAMIGLGNAQAYICGVMMIGVAGIFAFYSLYLFHYRALRIRVKDPGPYDDMIGPMVLVGIFIFVMVVSFIFRFPIKKTGLKAH